MMQRIKRGVSCQNRHLRVARVCGLLNGRLRYARDHFRRHFFFFFFFGFLLGGDGTN